MKTFGVRFCVGVFSLLGLVWTNSESQASGPVTAQQAVVQVQSAVTDASVGWRCWRCRRGYGWGGYGYGYGGYAYGGYYSGYRYPAYYARPRYYSAYSYAAPYQASCCGYTSYQPAVYGYSTYSYVPQQVVYSPSVYSTPSYYAPTYSSPTYSAPVYSTPTYYGTSYGSPVYAPSSTTPAVYQAPTSYAAPAPAPYPAPPADYTQPSAYRGPVASVPAQVAHAGLTGYATGNSSVSLIHVPSYSPTYAYLGGNQPAYSPPTYAYSITTPVASASYNLVW